MPAVEIGILMDVADTNKNSKEEPLDSAYFYLFEENPLPVLIYDIETLRILDVNKAAIRQYGYSLEEFVRLTLTDIRPPEDVPRMLQVVRGPRSPHYSSGEWRHRRKDGSIIAVVVTAHDVVHHGRPARFVLAQDITKRKREETANRILMDHAQKERHRLDSLLSQVPAIVWEFWNEPDESTMRINYVSAQVERLLGYPQAFWTENALFWLSVVHPDDRERAQTEAWAQYDSGNGGVSQFRCVAKDGRVVWVQSTSAVIVGDDGAKLGVRGVNIDITDRKAAEDALRESDERFRLVERATNDVIWDWDLTSGQLHHNDSVYTVFGYTPETIGHDGQWWYDQAHPDDREQVIAGIWEAINNGGTFWSGEYRFKQGDGSWANVMDRSYVMRNREGKAVRMIGSMVDVTESRRREESLRFLADASEALASTLDYEATLGNLAGLVVPFLADYCSIGILEEPDEIRRFALAHSDAAKCAALRATRNRFRVQPGGSYPLANVLSSGTPFFRPQVTEEDLSSLATDDEWSEIWQAVGPKSCMAVPLRAGGRVFGLIVFALCDTGRSYTEADLSLAEELARRASVAIDNAHLHHQIQLADAAKDEFLAMLSHELRNPLSAISNALELIRLRGKTDPLIQRTLDVVDRQSHHMARLVDDLLEVSRITQGKIELRKETVDLNLVVKETVETNQPMIDSRAHQVTVSLPDRPVWLDADPVRAAQVISNLLGNAAKYTEPGGRIDLTVTRDGADAQITVKDTGAGIAPAMLDNVFNLFTQANRSLDRSQGGLGIGLTVVKNIVALHGGTVKAKSDGLGKGSEFTVRIPALPEGQGPASTRTPGGWTDGNGSSHRILLVEDNIDAARTLAEILETWGNSVRLAHDGVAALEMARQAEADVVLMDIGMPGMDGYEVARHLREEGLLPRAILVALTGYGQEEDLRRSREAGFDQHLVKPVDFGVLEELLDSLSRT
jgi:PAS domain S-box-containing protein